MQAHPPLPKVLKKSQVPCNGNSYSAILFNVCMGLTQSIRIEAALTFIKEKGQLDFPLGYLYTKYKHTILIQLVKTGSNNLTEVKEGVRMLLNYGFKLLELLKHQSEHIPRKTRKRTQDGIARKLNAKEWAYEVKQTPSYELLKSYTPDRDALKNPYVSNVSTNF